MAAGLGFKTFTTGEVLTAADVNGYLMQGVLVFASEAARDAAITSPQAGQFAFTKDNNTLWYYSGSAWVAIGAGSSGKVLQVVSSTVTSTFTTSSTTFVDITSYSLSITPAAASSEVLILASFTLNTPGGATKHSTVRLMRDSTAIVDPITRANDSNNTVLESGSISYLDSPATTSATTYKIQLKTNDAAEPARIGSDYTGTPTYVYTITAMEIGA